MSDHPAASTATAAPHADSHADDDLVKHLDANGVAPPEVLKTQPVQPVEEHPEPHHDETSHAKDPLYKDKYLEIFADRVVIFKYFFPIATHKVILMEQIKSVHTDQELNLHTFNYKGWGMGSTNIWWALDLARGLVKKPEHAKPGHTGLVFEVKGAHIRKGCSVENPSAALAILQQHIHN